MIGNLSLNDRENYSLIGFVGMFAVRDQLVVRIFDRNRASQYVCDKIRQFFRKIDEVRIHGFLQSFFLIS